MFNVSRTTLVVIAVIALVLLALGVATDIGLLGWLLAIILGAYVVAALVIGRRADAERQLDEHDAQPPGAIESGAGIRHGQAPSNYVPPADEGRPPH